MGLERLNILFYFINFTGMLPFRMVTDKRTGHFKRLDSEWRHPITWWFIFISIAQLIWIPYFSVFSITGVARLQESTVYSLVIMLWQISYALVKFCPVLLIPHIGKLREAFVILANVDRKLMKVSMMENKPCTSKKRTIIGIISILIGIISIHFSAIPILITLHKSYGLNILIGMLLVEFISNFQLGIWFLHFHLTYYNIAHRISLLSSLITNHIPVRHCGLKIKVVPVKSNNNQLDLHLHKIGNLFDHLVKAARQLERVFSFPSLLVLTTSFLSCTIGLFIFIRELFTPTTFHDAKYLQIFAVTSSISFALVVILSADLPSQAAKKLREQVMRLSTQSQNLNDSTECTALLMSLSDDRFQLSASGLFVVKKQLIPSLTGTVITYLVILLQNAISKNKIENVKNPTVNSFNESSTTTG